MINVKILETGPTGTPGNWYYGPDYMVRIGKKDATGLCGMYPLPKIGYSVHVAIPIDLKNSPDFKRLLDVQNISGSYFLACSNVPKNEWPTVFGVTAQ